ncbi:MAG: GNAT family N-acetyltransferase [Sideroxydans sp.]|nr:GNAT family N-acetyltransferase [Sideroxydans sp.]
MTNEIKIRKATAADAQAIFDIRIAAINGQCTGHYPAHDLEVWTTWNWSQPFVQMIADKAYVATVGDKVVASGMVDLGSGQVDAVFVHPSQMRRGIGRMMMAYLEHLAIGAGLAQLKLDATLNAVPFYRSLGFVGDTVSSYCSSSGVSLACIPMIKRLPASQ